MSWQASNEPNMCNVFMKHKIQNLCNGQEESRLFSLRCEIFTNSAGQCCNECINLKKYVEQSQRRREEKNGIVDLKCNHRVMTQDDLIEKIAQEKSEK